MTIKAIIFDLDGTIAAFNLDYKSLRADVRGYLIKTGIPASILALNESIFDMLKKAELQMTNAGKSPEAIEEVREEALRMAEKYETEAAEQTSLLPGAIDTLKTLKKRKCRIALCTINSEKSTKRILDRFKLAEYFDAVTPRNLVNQVKPHPEHCETSLKALGVRASETLVVGDSVSDMRGAAEIKAIAVGLPSGVSSQEQLVSSGANYIITSIVDLPQLIDRINKFKNEQKAELEQKD